MCIAALHSTGPVPLLSHPLVRPRLSTGRDTQGQPPSVPWRNGRWHKGLSPPAGSRALLATGGRGGRGNLSFKTGRNNAPALAERGQQGASRWLELELRLVADVGIVGVPNAGKSTLLSVVGLPPPPPPGHLPLYPHPS